MRSWLTSGVLRVMLVLLFATGGTETVCCQTQKDSLHLYRKIKKAANKYRFTRWAYRLVFVDPEPREYPLQVPATPIKNVPARNKPKKQINPYLVHRGEIIRSIQIRVHDPFGYSVNDTLYKATNNIQKAGNSLHITTRKFIIRNRLLFKVNDSLDALRISESERLLREAVFINDARIFLMPSSSRDSVDLLVVVHDKWPVTVPAVVTERNANARFRNRNLFGSGNQFEQYGAYTRPDRFRANGFYNISNIHNTYISSLLGYSYDPSVTTAYLIFNKPFYSFLAEWAGGLAIDHSWSRYTISDTLGQALHAGALNKAGYDVWAAKNFKVSDRKTLFNQSTNMLLGARFYQQAFLSRPAEDIDTGSVYFNTAAFIGNVGFAVQQYYKDRFIYRFGANEDVPEGLILQFLYGGIKHEHKPIHYYNGIEIGRAKHFNFGYISATYSYGVFYNIDMPNDITNNYRLHFFSELLRVRRWYFRQFLNFNVVEGRNKLINQKISIRPEELYGFNIGSLQGIVKFVANSETVAYMPYNLIGFKFAPVLMVGCGMLGDQEHGFSKSRLFQAYSLGLMIRNENLLVSTFQFSVGWYPFLPDDNRPTFRVNPVTSFTLKVRAFQVARPEFVAY